MKIGTNLQFEKQIGYEKSLTLAAQAGFKYLDFDLTGNYDCDIKDEEKYFGNFLKIAQDLGVVINQAHAPYIKGQPTDSSVFIGKEFVEKVRASIRRAAILKCPYLVMHLYTPYMPNFENIPYEYDKYMEENIKLNLEFCHLIEKDLEEYGVNMAIENTAAYDFTKRAHAPCVCATSKECNLYIDQLGEKNFSVCFDAGHLNVLAGETHEQFVRALKGRISVLHLHDNFGLLNDWFGELDRHLPPYIGTLEWDKLSKVLKEIGFGGVYSFEVNSYGPTENALDNYKYIYKAGKQIFFNE